MGYRVLADLIVAIHFAWILFMLIGFFLTLYGFFWEKIFDWWLFRTLHLVGIVYVTLLALLGQYCPLTMLENSLRVKYHPESWYPGSFIMYYIERLVYPDVNPLIIIFPTILIALVTLVIFIIKPPSKIREKFIT